MKLQKSPFLKVKPKLENAFNIDLGDFYHTYLEIQDRKINRTKFLDVLREGLIWKMDDGASISFCLQHASGKRSTFRRHVAFGNYRRVLPVFHRFGWLFFRLGRNRQLYFPLNGSQFCF